MLRLRMPLEPDRAANAIGARLEPDNARPDASEQWAKQRPQQWARKIHPFQSILGTLRMGMLRQACLFREMGATRMSTYILCFRRPGTIVE